MINRGNILVKGKVLPNCRKLITVADSAKQPVNTAATPKHLTA